MAVSSLGAGSGVLTSDIIDKLKAADTAALITPIDKKITLQKQKEGALSLLSSLLTSFKASASALDDDALYQKRSVSGGTSAVSVTADAGVSAQSFSISDTILAKKNVQESGTFAATTSTIASGSGTMTLGINGTNYDIAYTALTTLDDLKTAINSTAGSSVTASTLQVGANDYRLILTSKETGASQNISLSDSVGGTLNNALLPYNPADTLDPAYDPTLPVNTVGIQTIQEASDASFKYNGITLTRATNSITDIVSGMTINLLQDSGSANIAITQDVSAISEAMSSFVTNYNTLATKLTELTTSDATNGTVGVFNGDSSIYGITRELNKIVTSINSDGLSLPQFGIDISQDGIMSFDSSKFLTKFNTDTVLSEKFFSGMTTTDNNENTVSVDGVFTSMSAFLDRYTASKGIMSTMTAGSVNDLKALSANKIRSQALLDARYEAMTARFSQYDALMTKLQNQFTSLQQQIDMAANGN